MTDNLPYVEALEKVVKMARPEIRREAASEILLSFQEKIINKYYLLSNQANLSFPKKFAGDLEKWQQGVAKTFSTP